MKPICSKHKVSTAYDLVSLEKLSIEDQSLAIDRTVILVKRFHLFLSLTNK